MRCNIRCNCIFICLQSNAGESDELYNFHEAVSLLIETEEQLIDEHKTSIEVSIKANLDYVVSSNGMLYPGFLLLRLLWHHVF